MNKGNKTIKTPKYNIFCFAKLIVFVINQSTNLISLCFFN
jgi:hypothetical protein